MIHAYKWFEVRLWKELVREFDSQPEERTVTCTEDNIRNLYESQFEDKTLYGHVFTYTDEK